MSGIRLSEISPSKWDSLTGRARDTVFGVDLRSTHVSYAWKDDNHLQITCIECEASRITLQKKSWKDITISYEISGSSAFR